MKKFLTVVLYIVGFIVAYNVFTKVLNFIVPKVFFITPETVRVAIAGIRLGSFALAIILLVVVLVVRGNKKREKSVNA